MGSFNNLKEIPIFVEQHSSDAYVAFVLRTLSLQSRKVVVVHRGCRGAEESQGAHGPMVSCALCPDKDFRERNTAGFWHERIFVR